jgi:hypothetical protein
MTTTTKSTFAREAMGRWHVRKTVTTRGTSYVAQNFVDDGRNMPAILGPPTGPAGSATASGDDDGLELDRKTTEHGGGRFPGEPIAQNPMTTFSNMCMCGTDPFTGTNDVVGAALATNSVTVNGQPAFHKWEYYWGAVSTNNLTSSRVAAGDRGERRQHGCGRAVCAADAGAVSI